MKKQSLISIYIVISITLLLSACGNRNNNSEKLNSNELEDKTNSLGVQETGIFTDSRDGKTYKTIKIGNQTWMAENLSYKATSGCWAYNDDISNVKTYGYLYDWETAKKSCPEGWHLPTDSEWHTLITYLGGEDGSGKSHTVIVNKKGNTDLSDKDVSGGKLKSTTGWVSPNIGATNSSGFSALPGGDRNFMSSTYRHIGKIGMWWSATEAQNISAWYRNIDSDFSQISRSDYYKNDGISVRCVKN